MVQFNISLRWDSDQTWPISNIIDFKDQIWSSLSFEQIIDQMWSTLNNPI